MTRASEPQQGTRFLGSVNISSSVLNNSLVSQPAKCLNNQQKQAQAVLQQMFKTEMTQ